MNTQPQNTEMLTATISFRLSELNVRADRENRTVSNLCRMLLRQVVQR